MLSSNRDKDKSNLLKKTGIVIYLTVTPILSLKKNGDLPIEENSRVQGSEHSH
jgi:hypothetical protein